MQLDPEPGAGAVPNSLYDVCVCKGGHQETQCQNANFAQDARFSERGNGFQSRVSCDYGLRPETPLTHFHFTICLSSSFLQVLHGADWYGHERPLTISEAT